MFSLVLAPPIFLKLKIIMYYKFLNKTKFIKKVFQFKRFLVLILSLRDHQQT